MFLLKIRSGDSDIENPIRQLLNVLFGRFDVFVYLCTAKTVELYDRICSKKQ